MTNWARTFLQDHPELAARPFTRHKHGFSFTMPDGRTQTTITPYTVHYESSPGVWTPTDTEMVDDGTYWGGTGTFAKIRKSDGSIFYGTKTGRPSRIVRYRPSNGSISNITNIPNVGAPVLDTWTRTWGDITYSIRISENSLSHTLTLATKQGLPGGTRQDDYVMIEEAISDSNQPDGWLDSEYVDGSLFYPLPTAWDARNPNRFPLGHRIPVRRALVTVGGQRYMLTGIMVSDYDTAVYPLVIDPDTFDSDSYDTVLQASGTSTVAATAWSDARSTSNYHVSNGTTGGIYTYGSYDDKSGYYSRTLQRLALKFDTSAIPDSNTVSDVTLSAKCSYKNVATNNNVYISEASGLSSYDPITSGNRDSAYDAILTAGGSLVFANTADITSGYWNTSGSLTTSYVNKTGSTYYGLWTYYDQSNTDPGDSGIRTDIKWLLRDNGANYPYITVTHAAAGTELTPGAASLSVTAQTPTLSTTANVLLTPGAASLTATAQTPTVTVPASTEVTPGVASLNITAQTPTVAVTANVGVTPGSASLSLTAQTPTAAATANIALTPGPATAEVWVLYPWLLNPQGGTPGAGTWTLTAQTPTVDVTTTGTEVTPGVATLTLTAQTPTAAATANVGVTPGSGSLTLTAQTPTATLNIILTPGAGSATATAYAATATVSDHKGVTPGTASLTITGLTPSTGATADLAVTPGTASLTLTAKTPTANVAIRLTYKTTSLRLPKKRNLAIVDGNRTLRLPGRRTLWRLQ